MYIVFFSIFINIVQTYNEHWSERAESAKSAEIYVKSDVCTKPELRVQVGKWQQCAESKYELRVKPSVRALYDTLEDFSICGHKRCEALAIWIQSYKYFLVAFFAGGLYFFYEIYKWQQHINLVNRYMNGRLPTISN